MAKKNEDNAPGGVAVVGDEEHVDVPEGEPAVGVEAGSAGGIDEDTAKARFVEKVNAGNFTFSGPEIDALSKALGVEDEVDSTERRFEGGEGSPMAGLTPATGSGGTPFEPDAATDETKKAAKTAAKDVDGADDNRTDAAKQLELANKRRLAASVK